jgi:hypothetical protein
MHSVRDKAHPKGTVFYSRDEMRAHCKRAGLEADVLD